MANIKIASTFFKFFSSSEKFYNQFFLRRKLRQVNVLLARVVSQFRRGVTLWAPLLAPDCERAFDIPALKVLGYYHSSAIRTESEDPFL
jgi:hypothetical protein